MKDKIRKLIFEEYELKVEIAYLKIMIEEKPLDSYFDFESRLACAERSLAMIVSEKELLEEM